LSLPGLNRCCALEARIKTPKNTKQNNMYYGYRILNFVKMDTIRNNINNYTRSLVVMVSGRCHGPNYYTSITSTETCNVAFADVQRTLTVCHFSPILAISSWGRVDLVVSVPKWWLIETIVDHAVIADYTTQLQWHMRKNLV